MISQAQGRLLSQPFFKGVWIAVPGGKVGRTSRDDRMTGIPLTGHPLDVLLASSNH